MMGIIMFIIFWNWESEKTNIIFYYLCKIATVIEYECLYFVLYKYDISV